MAALNYAGPGALFVRQIPAPFNDDPDWAVPTTPEPLDACWTMGANVTVPGEAVLTFVFYDVNSLEVVGGTADVYEFHVVPSFALGFGYELTTIRGVVRKGESVANLDLGKSWVMTQASPHKHGLRLSRIVAPFGAVRLVMSVAEKPQ